MFVLVVKDFEPKLSYSIFKYVSNKKNAIYKIPFNIKSISCTYFSQRTVLMPLINFLNLY